MKKQIILLQDAFADYEGEIIEILEETDNAVYYLDAFDRYVYLNKSEEEKIWLWWSE